MVKKIFKSILLIIVTFTMYGCKDTTYYADSEYQQININKLKNIQGKGYRLDGGRHDNGDSWSLFFCNSNRYAYTSGAMNDKIYRGSYHVDLVHDIIVMTGDDVNSQGKKLHCTFKTKSGYFEQEGIYLCEGNINIGFNDLEQINSSTCNIKKEAFE